ncbi:fibronectin type III domain-containing protein [Cellulomonas gilvus]|uniref:Fibronectin type III domain protein n=1 Tax=Cellulomonas gilvus (strain ATCC 13127 / NRRL B-14078) TaxID=593907 RepID=F8A2A6_CELGA|nr:fibronectin type III domain-containing protein [Cellulomonas gilvus]AEI11763.1 Fibronectin type III domain protein [Cellulomonas gilvus ATCC 13127]
MITDTVRRRATTTAAVVTVPAVVAVLALLNPGFPLAQVELNDGAVWLTATQAQKVGRYNVQVDELNAGLVTTSSTFDVLQDEGAVVVVESGAVSVVDPASVAMTTKVSVPGVQPTDLPGGPASMAAGVLAVVDTDGDLFVRTLAELGGLRPTEDDPDVALGEDGRAVVGRDGVVHAVDAKGAVTQVDVTAGAGRTSADGSFSPGALDQLTVVGDEPVGLRGSTVVTRDRDIEVEGQDLVLQQPGPDSSRVLVASSTALLEVPLDGGDVIEHPTQGSGMPAAPVQVDSCAHGAWASAVGSYQRLCEGEAPQVEALEEMSAQDDLVFRVNRSMVVLNDTLRGRVWEPQEDTKLRVLNWEDIQQKEDPEQDDTTSDQTTTTQELVEECSSDSANPVATSDEFGVRPGRTTVLPVVANDSSSDCGILAVRTFDQLPRSFGKVETIYGGRSLQVEVAPGASGTETFTYTIDDGRATSTPSTATVTLSVHGDGTNAPPVQDRVGTLQVEQGGQARYDVLSNFHDPDGDDLLLVDASTDSVSGTVRFRQDGTVTFRADGAELGRTIVTVLVSDGSDDEPTEGRLEVDVRPAGSVPPVIDPVHAVTYVDQTVALEPLAAVRTSGSEPSSLAAVDDVPGATVTPDLDAGTFTFSAPRVATYYVPFLVVSGTQQATGLARIDVQAWPEEAQPPVAVRDRAFLPTGGEVTINPLANDSDPAGGVLVLQSVDTSDAAGLSIAVLDHQLVQVRSERTLDHAVVLPYVVSNGHASATGQIVVQPLPPSASTQPPVVENVEVTVRAGGVVTIPVLESAYDPDGDTLTLKRQLAVGLAADEGLLFVSGDVLRYQAPARPLTARATFVVEDSTGNEASGTVTVRVHESDASNKPLPRPRDLQARVFAGEKVRIEVPLVGIDADGDGVALLGLASAPAEGLVTQVGADWLEYQADVAGAGTVEFQYAVEDWVGQRAVATVRVGVSPRPLDAAQVVARDDEVTIRPGERVEVRVLANDVDSSGDDLELEPTLSMEEGVAAQVRGRRIAVTAPEQEAVLQIGYAATNSRGGRDHAVLTVKVDEDAPVLPPIAEDVIVPAIETFGLTEVAVDVLETTQNPSGPPSDLRVTVPDSVAGVARVNDQQMVVVTLTDQTQTLPFEVSNVRDPENATSYAFVTVPPLGFIRPTPRPGAPDLRVSSGEELVISLDEQVQVAQGRRPTVANPLEVTATRGTVKVSEGGESLTFVSDEDFAGQASVTLPVTDATDANDTTARTSFLTFPIEVLAVEDHPPTFAPSEITVGPGEPANDIDLRKITTTPEGTTPEEGRYSYQITSAIPAGFIVSIEGSVLYVAAEQTARKDTRGLIELRIGFGKSGRLDVQLPLRVTASNRETARVLDRTVPDAVEGEPVTLDVLEGAFNPFAPTPLRVIGASVLTPGAGTATSSASSVTVTPAMGFIGSMQVRYRVQDATGDPDRVVEGRIALTVQGRPDAPGRPQVVETGDGVVRLRWDAPNNRGSKITGYRLTASSGQQAQCATTTCDFTGLPNGKAVTFTVAAQNGVGWSDESVASSQAIPDAVPDAVGSIRFDGRGDGSLTWSWDVPPSNGTPIREYVIKLLPAEAGVTSVVTRNVTSWTFTGLTNGKRYSISVQPFNDLPTGGPTTRSSEQYPAAPPGAPGDLQARRANTATGGQIDVTWSDAANNGDPVSEYQIVVDGPGGGTFGPTGPNSFTFRKAENGVEYTFRVRAKNITGWGPYAEKTALTYGVPLTPGGLSADAPAGAGEVRLSWNAVDRNGSPNPVRYTVFDGGTEVYSGQSTWFWHSGLAGGSEHRYTVMATNDAGSSDRSGPVSATPTTPPGQPQGLKIEKTAPADASHPQTVAVSWDAVSSGGGADLRYEYKLSTRRGDDTNWIPTTGTSDNVTVTDWDIRPDGTTFTLRVRAITSIGQSEASQVKDIGYGEKPSEPTSPTLTLATGDAGNVLTADWGEPTYLGGLPVRYEYCWRVDDRKAQCTDTGSHDPVSRSFGSLGVDADEDHTFRFSVVAYNDRGSSATVNAPDVTYQPTPPPDPPASGGGAADVGVAALPTTAWRMTRRAARREPGRRTRSATLGTRAARTRTTPTPDGRPTESST